jgi:hypothetical protein
MPIWQVDVESSKLVRMFVGNLLGFYPDFSAKKNPQAGQVAAGEEKNRYYTGSTSNTVPHTKK